MLGYGGIVATNSSFSIKTLFVLFTGIIGCLSLIFIYQTWGSVSLYNGIIFAITIGFLTLFESQLFNNNVYIALIPAWILGMGLFYGPKVLLFLVIGRAFLLLRRSYEVNPVFQWGREAITYFSVFLFLYSATPFDKITYSFSSIKFYRDWFAAGSIVPVSELLGFVTWGICSKKTKINLPVIATLTLISLLWVFAAPLQVYLFKHYGLFMLTAGIFGIYLAGIILSKLVEVSYRYYKYQQTAYIIEQISALPSHRDALREIFLFLQMKLPTDNIAVFSITEPKDTWNFVYALGKNTDWEQKIENLDKMQWKQLFQEERMGLYLQKQFSYNDNIIVFWLVSGKELSGSLIITGVEKEIDSVVVENLRAGLGEIIIMLMKQFVLQRDHELLCEDVQDLREQLKQTKAQLVHSSKISTIGQMAAGVSHEINNPIGAILTNAQFLEIIIQGDTEKECLGNIITAARRCKDITQKLLNYSRVETVEFAEINLNEVVNNTVSMLQYSFSIDRVQLHKELFEIPFITGNFNEMSQVLTNLLINAKDAILGRKLSFKEGLVQVRTRSSDGYVFLEVEDNGIGMSEHVVGKIFHPFFTTKDIGKGTGMGLSICKGIVENHHGEIIVTSKEGKGSMVTVKLPAIRKGGNNNGSEDSNS